MKNHTYQLLIHFPCECLEQGDQIADRIETVLNWAEIQPEIFQRRVDPVAPPTTKEYYDLDDIPF
ncbi:hypothetical protein [Picosynechococcus sp. NKBG042902]|uniref:hypothetical protein n=1 Tax=Picosynechococcus sp. NKBG042902 TaxID=490193 RepID=UPI0004AA9A1C|nr:hypothetical protein [Picosynechococcus sp. NKBG042902]